MARLVVNYPYRMLCNYGGLKEGLVLKIKQVLKDCYLVIWRGRPMYIPQSFVSNPVTDPEWKPRHKKSRGVKIDRN